MKLGYKATRAPDGTLTVCDVPIFVACARGEMNFDDDWIRAAVANAQLAARENYLPPLHVRHHNKADPDQAKAAGFFRITRTETITFKGSPRTAIMADLVITDPSVSFDVLAKRLPYRSVEIFDATKPAIGSLALLDHEAPYLELPMLMVSDVQELGAPGTPTVVARATFQRPWPRATTASKEPVVACFQRGQAFTLLTEDDAVNEDEIKKTKMAAEDTKAEDAPAAVDCSSIVKMIEDGSISVADMDAILTAIQGMKAKATSTAEDKKDDKSATGGPAPSGSPGESMTKTIEDSKFVALQADIAKLRGENDALKMRVDGREAADKRTTDVAAAMKRLTGRPLGADFEAKLVKFHADYGAAAFAGYVESLVTTLGVLPQRDAAAAHFAAQSGTDFGAQSSAVLAFQAAGPDAVAKAAQFSREWRALNENGAVRMDEARYVEINMQKAGVKKPATAKSA